MVLKDGENQELQKSQTENSEELQNVEVMEVSISNEREKVDDQIETWSTPVKVSRTQEKAKEREFDQDSILSSSRFAVLSSEDDEEEGEIPQHENIIDEAPLQVPIQKKQEVLVKATVTRPSLPRISKDNHRILSSSNAPKTTDCGQSLLDKKSTKK